MYQSDKAILLGKRQKTSLDQRHIIRRLHKIDSSINAYHIYQVFLVHHLKGMPRHFFEPLCEFLNAELVDDHSLVEHHALSYITMPIPALNVVWNDDYCHLLNLAMYKDIVRIDVAWMYTFQREDAQKIENHSKRIDLLFCDPAWQELYHSIEDIVKKRNSPERHTLHAHNAPFEQSEIFRIQQNIYDARQKDMTSIKQYLTEHQILPPDLLSLEHKMMFKNSTFSVTELLTSMTYHYINNMQARYQQSMTPGTISLYELFHVSQYLGQDPLHRSVVIEDKQAYHLALIQPRTRHYIDFIETMNHVIVEQNNSDFLDVCPFLAGQNAVLKGSRTILSVGRGAIEKMGAVALTLGGDSKRSSLSHLEDMMNGIAYTANRTEKSIVTGFVRQLYPFKTKSGSKDKFGFQSLLSTLDVGIIEKDIFTHEALYPGLKLVQIGCPVRQTGLGLAPMVNDSTMIGKGKLFPFASPESFLRCKRLIQACIGLKADNLILDVEIVADGGLAQAVRQIVDKSGCGVEVDLRHVPLEHYEMLPHEIWLSESAGRFVLLVDNKHLPLLFEYANRESCPFAVIGSLTSDQNIRLIDEYFADDIVNIPCKDLDSSPSQVVPFRRSKAVVASDQWPKLTPKLIEKKVPEMLQLISIADKTSILTLLDRNPTGLVVRDPFVGPYQIPVSDVAVTQAHALDKVGEALALGERPMVAMIDVEMSLKLAVAEALTNLASAYCGDLSSVSLTVSLSVRIDDQTGYESAHAAMRNLYEVWAKELGVNVYLGDVHRYEPENDDAINNPVGFIVSATAPVLDVKKTLSPVACVGDDVLLAIDLSEKNYGLAASAFAEVQGLLGDDPATADFSQLPAFFNTIQYLIANKLVSAYHDRSDGGFIVALIEMCFATHAGMDINLDGFGRDYLSALLDEGPGAVIQVSQKNLEDVMVMFDQAGLGHSVIPLGRMQSTNHFNMTYGNAKPMTFSLTDLHEKWSRMSYYLQHRRSSIEYALSWHQGFSHGQIPILKEHALFKYPKYETPDVTVDSPKVAVLRDGGSKGHLAYAMACRQAGFMVTDITLRDLEYGHETLDAFDGLIVSGGFSFNDMPEPGRAWAKAIVHKNEHVLKSFETFFKRKDAFTIGIGNGCHALMHLRSLIPGSDEWPMWLENESEQFECRYVNVVIPENKHFLFEGMEGSILVTSVACQYGRIENHHEVCTLDDQQIVMQYADHLGHMTETYPTNPTGSLNGICGYTSKTGRVTLLMPHIERDVFVSQQSWKVDMSSELCSPWIQVFVNARRWVEARIQERPPLS